jgi:hypothetical protein
MKTVFMTLLATLVATSAFAAKTSGGGQIGSGNVGLTKGDFLNSYIVAKLAIEGPYYVAQFEVNGTGDNVIFRDANMDNVAPDNNCVGDSFEIEQNIVKVSVVCKKADNARLNFEIDISGISRADLEKGTKAQVRSEATGGNWFPFSIIKRNKSFF